MGGWFWGFFCLLFCGFWLNFYFLCLILFFFPGKLIWVLHMHNIVLKVSIKVCLFSKLHSIWTWCISEVCLKQLCDYRMLSFVILLYLVIHKQYDGSLCRLDKCSTYESAFVIPAPYISEQRTQIWLKSLKVWRCFIHCVNNEPSSLSILFYFEDCIWNRVTFMRSLLVGMFVWIDPQNPWPARLSNWHWGLVFILT